MMDYIIREQNTLEIIYTNKSPLPDNLEANEVYNKFDPETMFFYQLGDEEKVVDNRVVAKNEAEIVETKLAKNQIETKKAALEGLKSVGRHIEKEIGEKFSVGYELKLTRGYLTWMIDGKPGKDEREKKYLTFQEELEKIKEKYSKLRAKLKKILKNPKIK